MCALIEQRWERAKLLIAQGYLDEGEGWQRYLLWLLLVQLRKDAWAQGNLDVLAEMSFVGVLSSTSE